MGATIGKIEILEEERKYSIFIITVISLLVHVRSSLVPLPFSSVLACHWWEWWWYPYEKQVSRDTSGKVKASALGQKALLDRRLLHDSSRMRISCYFTLYIWQTGEIPNTIKVNYTYNSNEYLLEEDCVLSNNKPIYLYFLKTCWVKLVPFCVRILNMNVFLNLSMSNYFRNTWNTVKNNILMFTVFKK